MIYKKNKRKDKYNPLYKHFLNLKTNPLNNNKFLTWKPELKYEKFWCENRKKMIIKIPKFERWLLTKKFSKEKWKEFLNSQIRSQQFFNRFKPFAHINKASKFASKANSYRKKFKNNLLTKTMFSFLYGGFSKKYLKTRMANLYKSNNSCFEFFESRLDSILYQSKFCISMRTARQIITHEHVKVNGIVEKNNDYLVNEGDTISLTKKTREFIKKNLEKKFQECPNFIIWPMPPRYLNINYKTLEILIGNITNFDFSTSFTLKLETHSIVKNNHRY